MSLTSVGIGGGDVGGGGFRWRQGFGGLNGPGVVFVQDVLQGVLVCVGHFLLWIHL